ncbi:hypothetical protein BGZ70_001160 [Mortierella alpina]|uniref:Uncharacterized protein n=1 Tax=Mortierella alpina TaxID=64518 RepID=A0A9P6LX91_MORAP|nr:hypothetical protein BGZ70_001160 [Mortierella alpina]
MPSREVVAQAVMTTNSIVPVPRQGLATIKTMTNALRRHSFLRQSDAAAIPSLFLGSSLASKRLSLDRAAERDKREQAKQVFQLSTVNDQGLFLPPEEPLLEKGFLKEHGCMDCDEEHDHFATIIINTPPERIRTFLSAESTISPGMFSSLQSSRIRRNTIPSFKTPLSTSEANLPTSPHPTHQQPYNPHVSRRGSTSTKIVSTVAASSLPSDPPSRCVHPPSVTPVAFVKTRHVLTPADTLSTPPSSPPESPLKNTYFAPNGSKRPRSQLRQSSQQPPPSHRNNKTEDVSPIRSRNKATISFLTGAGPDEDDLFSSDAISDTFKDSFQSTLSSSLPELVMDDDDEAEEGDHSRSESVSTPEASPRQPSAALSLYQKEQTRLVNARKLKAQNNFGGELPIAH